MRYVHLLAWITVASLGAIGCGNRSQAASLLAESSELQQRENKLVRRLVAAAGDSTRSLPLAQWLLPPGLREISGLALTADARLLAHNDEQGQIFVIDPRRGVLLKRFSLGRNGTTEDFEGITVVGDSVYMIVSNGKIYSFKEGADGERVAFSIHDTKLGRECEFEGVAFEPDSAWLLLPCKTVRQKELRDQLVIYRWKLGGKGATSLSMLTLPLAWAVGSNSWKNLHPSDITIDPASGNYVLIASKEKALIEITPAGDVVRSVPLPGKRQHPEGVAITADGMLIVSDESEKRPATITLYRWPFDTAAVSSP